MVRIHESDGACVLDQGALGYGAHIAFEDHLHLLDVEAETKPREGSKPGDVVFCHIASRRRGCSMSHVGPEKRTLPNDMMVRWSS